MANKGVYGLGVRAKATALAVAVLLMALLMVQSSVGPTVALASTDLLVASGAELVMPQWWAEAAGASAAGAVSGAVGAGAAAAVFGTPAALPAAGVGAAAGAVGGFLGYAAATGVEWLLGRNMEQIQSPELISLTQYSFDH